MPERYINEAENPPEDLIALCGMFNVEWRYVKGYGARTWELWVSRPDDLPGGRLREMARRTQSVLYDDWVKVLDELIAFRDKGIGCPTNPTGMP